MAEVCGAFIRFELVEQFADLAPRGFEGALIGFAEQGLELGEEHLDGVEIRRSWPGATPSQAWWGGQRRAVGRQELGLTRFGGHPEALARGVPDAQDSPPCATPTCCAGRGPWPTPPAVLT